MFTCVFFYFLFLNTMSLLHTNQKLQPWFSLVRGNVQSAEHCMSGGISGWLIHYIEKHPVMKYVAAFCFSSLFCCFSCFAAA